MLHYVDMKPGETTLRNKPDAPRLAAGATLLRAATAADRMRFTRQVRAGELERLDHGLYRNPSLPYSAHHELAAVGLRRPSAVICLISALSYHGLTDLLPHVVTIAIDPKERRPRWSWPAIEVVTMPLKRYADGIEVVMIEDIPVRITDIPRTLADCWKHEELVGRATCLAATKLALQQRSCSVDQVMAHLDAYRLTNRVTPLVEALLT